MVEFSAVGEPIQADNKKWNRGWGNWSVINKSGTTVRGAVMIPQKTENEDWLIAESVDLSDYARAKLNFEGYYRYGTDVSKLSLLVADNYNGDVASATWVELTFDALLKDKAAEREVDLSQFAGKDITIALKHSSLLSGSLALTQFSRSHCIVDFRVSAIRK